MFSSKLKRRSIKKSEDNYSDLFNKINSLCDCLNTIYHTNSGGCCYVAYVIAEILEREYVAFADKCWPAFPEAFGFEPCYVNSRLASRGIPVSCEVDIYGALSEYIGACITNSPVTLLDINNTVPRDMYESEIKDKTRYGERDVFMGFHCGNTPLSCLSCGEVNYQIIQNRLLEKGGEPDFTRGTLEGDIKSGDITLYRLHANATVIIDNL